jgi:hypothetical protein
MLIFHQAGHNSVWNKNTLQKNIGDGLIISPVHWDFDKVSGLDNKIKRVSLFDPQFYVPDSQKTRLNSYNFFPENFMNGFATDDFAAVAYDAAQLCVDFQIGNNFRALVIPARYYNDMLTDFIEKQRVFSVDPFLNYVEKKKVRKDIFLTLPLTASMIGDNKYRVQLLNWVTSYPQITGVYLLVTFDESLKQICSHQKLMDYIYFVNELSRADLKVICGYCNTEAILWTILLPHAVTIGAYENTRRFSIDKFLDDESEVRGPAPRIYFPKLLNWVRFDTAMEIKEDLPDLWKKVYTPTKALEALLKGGARPHFTKPELYYHHFELIHGQIKEVASLSKASERISLVKKWIDAASELYSEIHAEGILFYDNNCKGEHLPGWNRVIRKLSRE